MANERESWEKLSKKNPFNAAVRGTSQPSKPSEFLFNKMFSGSSVLDVGVGYGRNAIPLSRRHKCSVIGLDFSKAMCKAAKKNGVDAVMCDVRHLPFKEDAFDYVVSIHILSHLKTQLTEVLSEFSRVAFTSIFDVLGNGGKKQKNDPSHESRRTIYYRTLEGLERICLKIFHNVTIERAPYVVRMLPNREVTRFICECTKRRVFSPG